MASEIKLQVFKGVANKDQDLFWLVVKAIWEAQGVTEDNMKKEVLVSTLQDHTVTWYIKNSNDNTNVGITDLQVVLNSKFSRPKSETQSIIGFKQIVMLPGETPW